MEALSSIQPRNCSEETMVLIFSVKLIAFCYGDTAPPFSEWYKCMMISLKITKKHIKIWGTLHPSHFLRGQKIPKSVLILNLFKLGVGKPLSNPCGLNPAGNPALFVVPTSVYVWNRCGVGWGGGDKRRILFPDMLRLYEIQLPRSTSEDSLGHRHAHSFTRWLWLLSC